MSAANDGAEESHIFFRTNGTNVVISEEWVLPVPVANAHTLVSFTFQTTGGDISFSMVFIGLSGEEEVLIAPSRMQSDLDPVHESLRLSSPGTLILLWDNSYSWLHKKELSYSLQIEQDPDLDVNGQPKDMPLSLFEEARAESAKKQQKALLAHMTHLKHKLLGVEDILRTVSPAEIEELELSLARLRHEIAMKKSLLQTSRTEQREAQRLLKECERFRAPLNIRTLSGKTLSSILDFLEPSQSSLVCKYWCQVTAYLTEKRDNPDLTDDDFEILFDYESRGLGQVSIPQSDEEQENVNKDYNGGGKRTSRRVSGDMSAHSHGDYVHNSAASERGNNSTQGRDGGQGNDELSQSQNLSDAPESPFTAGVEPSPSEDEETLQQEVLHSVAQQQTHTRERQGPKKVNISEYPDDIKQYLRASLSAMSRMEGEKVEIKGRIHQWKINFERRHRRPPSDQEKLTNISTFFQKYSKLKRAIKVEEDKIFRIANAIDKLQD